MANITDTQMETLLNMLKYNLEIITDYMDDEAKQQKELELTQYIMSSASYIEREGIELDFYDNSDNQLVTMYASWLYDQRKNGVTLMPRMLRYNLNNRLFSSKV